MLKLFNYLKLAIASLLTKKINSPYFLVQAILSQNNASLLVQILLANNFKDTKY